MARAKRVPMAAVWKTVVIVFVGFGVAWMLLLVVTPPAAATRLGFAARITWPVAHLLLTSVLALGGGAMVRTIRGSVLPVSRRSRKIGWSCCWAALVLTLVYVGSMVVLSREHGSTRHATVNDTSKAESRAAR